MGVAQNDTYMGFRQRSLTITAAALGVAFLLYQTQCTGPGEPPVPAGTATEASTSPSTWHEYRPPRDLDGEAERMAEIRAESLRGEQP